MKVLVVGAGAVGQVFAHHAVQAGADVSFFVREQYVEQTRQGFNLYPLNRSTPRARPVALRDFEVFSEIDQIARRPWDHVYLCIPSTGLRGQWFENFVQAIADAILINLTPGFDDRQYIHDHFIPDHVVTGMISFISYPGPLPGEALPTPGTVYWFPPLSSSPFEGQQAAVESVVRFLQRGKLPAKIDQKLPTKSVYPSALLMCFIATLELEGWSFDSLKNSPRIPRMVAAINEATAALAAYTNKRPPLPFRALTPATIKLLLPLATKFTPLDLEAFLHLHFLKVRAQSLLQLTNHIQLARQHQLPHQNLQALFDDLQAHNP